MVGRLASISAVNFLACKAGTLALPFAVAGMATDWASTGVAVPEGLENVPGVRMALSKCASAEAASDVREL